MDEAGGRRWGKVRVKRPGAKRFQFQPCYCHGTYGGTLSIYGSGLWVERLPYISLRYAFILGICSF